MKRGFTLLEVLTVIAVIGILVGLLLPGIQAAREVARMRQCLCNMTQLSLAVGAYHSSFDRFPAGTVGQRSPLQEFPGDYHHSWLIRCLPYLDGNALIHRLDTTRSVYDPVNRFVRDPNVRFDILACPSDPYSYTDGTSSYAGVYSGHEQPISVDSDGFMVMNHFFQIGDISDGLATTLMIGEKRITSADLGWASGTSATLRNTGQPVPGQESNRYAGWDSEYDWAPPSEYQDDSGTYAYGWYLGDQKQSLEQYDALVAGTVMADDTTSDDTTSDDVRQTKPVENPFLLNPDLIKEPDDGDGENLVDGEDEFEDYWKLPSPVYSLPWAPAISGPLAPDARSFSSHHQSVSFVYGDGHLASISPEIDAQVFSQLGNRHDRAPLTRPSP